jgi:hypothetical protein
MTHIRIMIMFVLLVLLNSGCAEIERHLASEPTFEEAQEIAEQWIILMPTYKYDGSNLTLIEHSREDTHPSRHLLIYSFTCSHEGYGDRSDEMLAEKVTSHTIWVVLNPREVQSAVIDEKWDELRQQYV